MTEPQTPAPSFQSRVLPWLMECFGAEIAGNIEERCDRFIEEALEQVQSLDWPKERAHALVEYVYGRPVGVPHQEAGGVMVTFAALCQAAGLDMQAAGDDELARIMRPEIVLKIRAKQAAKPTGSALPVSPSVSGGGRTMSGELVARLEVAEAPCRDLDAEIARAFGGQVVARFGDYDWRAESVGIWRALPMFTTSLDAALALAERVLPGASWRIDFAAHSTHSRTIVEIEGDDARATGTGNTPALALCLAILRATTPGETSSASERVE